MIHFLPKGMHTILNQELSVLKKKEKLFIKIRQPGTSKRDTLYKKFAFQSENLWTTVDEGKYLNISENLTYWDLGPSALNEPNLNFGNTEKEKYDTDYTLGLKFTLSLSTILILFYFVYPSKLIEIISKITII